MKNDSFFQFDLPEVGSFKTKSSQTDSPKSPSWMAVVLISALAGFLAGTFAGALFYSEGLSFLEELKADNQPVPEINIQAQTESNPPPYESSVSREEAIIEVVDEVSPAVVSIVITKELPVYEQYYYDPFEGLLEDPLFEFQVPQYRQKGVEERQVGGGTGFIVSGDGLVVTNKHVVSDQEAEYTVVTSQDERYPVEVLARDPFQDIALLQIRPASDSEELPAFAPVKLGDSEGLKRGQTAIAIGYVLGRYENTVSVGVVSGLGRTVTASGGGFYETLEDVIQTDAAINRGNSGGPLLNLRGEVIGINTAIDVQGQNIGFAVPVNKAKRDIEQFLSKGEIVYPFIGVRYALITPEVQEQNDLPVDYGAWVIQGPQGEPAISPDSPAQEAGLREGDIILELNDKRITPGNSLSDILLQYDPGEEITLKILRNSQEQDVDLVLGERS
ncbi:MAG: trypsin-like serine protease [Candidatus Nealsonbacteria bacterium]|nr:trypsin-like serine protease [Candidatus Nealsonbacteria bacterium]